MIRPIKIAICDDSIHMIKITQARLNNVLHDYKHLKFEVYTFTSGLDLLSSDTSFDVIILDIEMPEFNGFDVARKLNEADHKPLIIFYTGYAKRAIGGYEYRPFDFVMKNMPNDKFEGAINRAIDEVVNAGFIEISTIDSNLIYCKVTDICHITAFAGTTIITVGKNEYVNSKRLKHWIATLPHDQFFQINRETIINLNKLNKVENNKIYLENSSEFPISRRRIKDFKNARVNYVRAKKRY